MSEKAAKESNYRQKNKNNRKPGARCVNIPTSVKDVRINLRRAKFKPKRQSVSQELNSEQYQPPPQPKARWLPYDDISDVEEEGEDFESLLTTKVTTLVSAGERFSFKGEKDWNLDNSQSSKLSEIQLRRLNASVSCSPSNECIGLDDSHVSKNEFTYIENATEKLRKDDENISRGLSISNTTKSDERTEHESDDLSNTKLKTNLEKGDKHKSKRTEGVRSSEIENLEDDLDFLLTLKEPVISGPTTIPQVSFIANVEEPKNKSASVATKSIDLEKWLDSLLDV